MRLAFLGQNFHTKGFSHGGFYGLSACCCGSQRFRRLGEGSGSGSRSGGIIIKMKVLIFCRLLEDSM